MNPVVYLGRAELPLSLKEKMRPINVFAPDILVICENMLISMGFFKA